MGSVVVASLLPLQSIGWPDAGGAVSARFVIFYWGKKVNDLDTRMDEKLAKERVEVLVKCNRAYLHYAALSRATGKQIYDLIPPYFRKTQARFAAATSKTAMFILQLLENGYIESSEAMMLEESFIHMYMKYYGLKQTPPREEIISALETRGIQVKSKCTVIEEVPAFGFGGAPGEMKRITCVLQGIGLDPNFTVHRPPDFQSNIIKYPSLFS
jgi:hypothetical protein